MLDGFLKFDGIDGECKDADHEGWIDVTALQWGVSQEVVVSAEGKLGPGTPDVRTFGFTQVYGRASPTLFHACASGRPLPVATFESRIGGVDGPEVVLHIAFKDCLITSVQTGSQGPTVTEKIEVAFRSINVETKERPTAFKG